MFRHFSAFAGPLCQLALGAAIAGRAATPPSIAGAVLEETPGVMFGEERAVWKKGVAQGDNRADAWRLPGRIVGLRLVGFLDVPFAKDVVSLIRVSLDATPNVGKLVAFCDYTALSGAEPAARQMIQDAVKAQKDRFEVLHYLVSSKILALAVQVSGLWHGIPSRTWTSAARAELELVRVEAAEKKP